MDYVNLDMVLSDNRFTLVKTDNIEAFNKDRSTNEQQVYKSSDGLVIAKEKKQTPISRIKDAKIYKLYEIQKDDTLQTLVKRFLNENPVTRKYYTESQLINEIVSTNGLKDSSNSLSGINFLTIPSYLSVPDEEKEELPDYEEHFVTVHEQNYYQIVLNEGYTNDSDEILRLSEAMKELNGTDKPIVFSKIKIPCVRKYRMEHPTRKR